MVAFHGRHRPAEQNEGHRNRWNRRSGSLAPFASCHPVDRKGCPIDQGRFLQVGSRHLPRTPTFPMAGKIWVVQRERVAIGHAHSLHPQEQHHRNITFQEEFLALLKKHRIEFDEQYLWDWVQPSLRDSLRSYVFPAVNCRAIIGSPFGTTAPFPPQKCPNSRRRRATPEDADPIYVGFARTRHLSDAPSANSPVGPVVAVGKECPPRSARIA